MTYEQVVPAKAAGAFNASAVGGVATVSADPVGASKAGAARGLSAVPAKAAVGASKAVDARGLPVAPAKPAVRHQTISDDI